jgi:phospholipid N-methyltransferase
MAEVTPDSIFQIASGFMAAKHLFVANEVGLFAQLAEGSATLDDLAQRLGLPRRTTRMVADAMVALGLVQRTGDHYQNSPVAATFLSGRTPTDVRPILRQFNHLSYPRWTHLEEAVRTGTAVFGEFAFTAEEQQIYSEGVEAITAGTAQALAAQYDFSPHHRVLDLGGGTGSFLLAILRRYPALACTLFELPPVAAVARRHLTATPLAQGLRIVEGDFFQDPIPAGHDVIIIANVWHNYSPEGNCALLRRVRQSVAAETRLLLVDFWTDPTHTEPLAAALMVGGFLLTTGEGDVYSAAEVHGWLQETRWRLVAHVPLGGPSSLIVAEPVT